MRRLKDQEGLPLSSKPMFWLLDTSVLKLKTRSSKSSEKSSIGNSLAVHWLGLCASTAGGTGSIPGQGTKIPRAA